MIQEIESSIQKLESVECVALTSGMARAFADMVTTEVERRGWSMRDFASRAESTYTPDGAIGYVSKILAGKTRLPAKKIERWADALRLDGDDRDRFIALAWLARSDERVEAMFLALESKVAELERRPPRR